MTDRTWVHEAIARIEADFARSADTHLIRVELPAHPGIDLYLKDESTHPTGSLKHRLARSLFLYGLCNGWIGPGTTVVEVLLGLDRGVGGLFRAAPGPAVHRGDAGHDLARQDRQDRVPGRALPFRRRPARGLCREPPARGRDAAGTISTSSPIAERATDWRGNNNIAESIFGQMRLERHPEPRLGGVRRRHRRDLGHDRALHPLPAAAARGLCVVDPERSVFHRHWADRSVTTVDGPGLLHRGHRPAAGRALVHTPTWSTG